MKINARQKKIKSNLSVLNANELEKKERKIAVWWTSEPSNETIFDAKIKTAKKFWVDKSSVEINVGNRRE